MATSSVSRRLRQLQRRGVAVPRPARPRPNSRRRVTDEQVLAFIREGPRPVEIAARTGIAHETVSWSCGICDGEGCFRLTLRSPAHGSDVAEVVGTALIGDAPAVLPLGTPPRSLSPRAPQSLSARPRARRLPLDSTRPRGGLRRASNRGR